MINPRSFRICFPLFMAALLPLAGLRRVDAQPSLTIRNNHEIPFTGAIEVPVNVPDGDYWEGTAHARVTNGVARAHLSLAPGASARLVRSPKLARGPRDPSALQVLPSGTSLALRWKGTGLGQVEFGLAAFDGKSGSIETAVQSFAALPIVWAVQADGQLRGVARASGYDVQFRVFVYGEGAVDFKSRITKTGGGDSSAYVALVRRVTTPRASDVRLRFNGREFPGGDSPSIWDRDFWYTRGVDWTAWRANTLALLSVNGFAPAPTTMRDGVWSVGSHFYVWEKSRLRGDTLYLVSEIAGPNPDQSKSGYMGVTPYAPLLRGDTVALKWRLALNANPESSWPESQLRVFSGYRGSSGNTRHANIDLGVRSVVFGTSYFPYSTLAENFDYYRTPGLNSENFWPASTAMWMGWRTYVPRMRTDLHIARTMGFDFVRLHHLELLRDMKRSEALAFLDFYINEASALGMKVMIDSEGPAEWLRTLATRYRDAVTRIEIENENLIPGIKPADAERWKTLYAAVKEGSPKAQVFLTGAGNNGMFERLRALGVPFDRVGLHAYKHGPQWKEAYASHMLGSSGYATDIGKEMTLGEFNWKDLTRMSPEMRRGEVATIYETVLRPRAVPEFFEFQFQESLTFNPSVAGSNSRHYEPLALDRRPKPEAFELMRVIRDYGRADAPVREMPVTVAETQFAGSRDSAGASFTVVNKTARTVRLKFRAIAYDGVQSSLRSPKSATLRPNESFRGELALALLGEKRAGTYHHFVVAEYDGKKAYGWGVASKRGIPQFGSSVLRDRVFYPQGADVVTRARWNEATAVAYGAGATVLELESAYQLATTLQSATGRHVRVSSIADLPDSIIRNGLVVLVGTPTSNALIPATAGTLKVADKPGIGIIWFHNADGRQSLVLSGSDTKAVQAAVVELELRYWPRAKDATIRITGMEPGAALGNRAGGPAVDPP